MRVVPSGLPTIVIGNLSVGGTGKTPHAEYVIRLLLKLGRKPGFLSRGYGRRTNGVVEITMASTADEVGDEPLQVYRHFAPALRGCVSEDRVAGAKYLKTHYPDLDVLVLDDAFQHRRIARDRNILLTTYKNPFYQDVAMPGGTLRESRAGAARAGAIVVTKCPRDLSEEDRQLMIRKIRPYSQAPVFFSTYRLGAFHTLTNDTCMPEAPVAVMAGIADGKAFAESVEERLPVTGARLFGDHHHYTSGEVDRISEALLQTAKTIVTTEKDAVKLAALPLRHYDRFYYMPVETEFLFGEEGLFHQFVIGGVYA